MDLKKEEKITKTYYQMVARRDRNAEYPGFLERMKSIMNYQWFYLLKNEMMEKYFINLGRIVYNMRTKEKVYPETIEETFSIFKNTNPYEIKVVIVGQDPYPDGSYDGRAFSNSEDSLKISPSLKNILKEVEDDIYGGMQLDQNPSLIRWENQGVFLINRVLTVSAGKPGSHRGIGWEVFTNRVIALLSQIGKQKVFMLWGNDAKSLAPMIEKDRNLILTSGHPSPLSANRGGWFGNKHFSKANEFLRKNNIKEIDW